MSAGEKIYPLCSLESPNGVICNTAWLFSMRVLHKEHFVPYYFPNIY
jgi:hypothetical protein